MSVTSLGDMAQQFTSLRNTNAIKTELAIQTERLSTGYVEDITAALDGQTARFSAIDYSLTQLDAYGQIAAETQQTLENVQIALSRVDDERSLTAERLLLVSDASTDAQIDEAAASSRNSFETMVSTLNTQVGDRALLSGARVDTPPLASADDMLADLVATIGTEQDPVAIASIVDAWFDDPTGGFAIMGYLGDTGQPVQKRISETQTIEMTARADDPAIKETLKGAALAALASELPVLDREAKTVLLQDAGARLFTASTDIVALQARVGFSEARVEQSLSQTKAQETSLGIARNDLIQADPYETAARLQALQLQLETHFAATARTAELSLLRFI